MAINQQLYFSSKCINCLVRIRFWSKKKYFKMMEMNTTFTNWPHQSNLNSRYSSFLHIFSFSSFLHLVNEIIEDVPELAPWLLRNCDRTPVKTKIRKTFHNNNYYLNGTEYRNFSNQFLIIRNSGNIWTDFQDPQILDSKKTFGLYLSCNSFLLKNIVSFEGYFE